MYAYKVGSLYHPDVTRWPRDVDQYNFRGGGHELVRFLSRPTPAEVAAVRVGAAEFALLDLPPAVFLLFRFGGHPWSDAPYSYHLVPKAERAYPPESLDPDARALMTVMLVNSDTGILKAIRAITLSPEFTRNLHAALAANALADWPGRAAYDAALAAAYRRFPTTESMLAAPGVTRCRGGE